MFSVQFPNHTNPNPNNDPTYLTDLTKPNHTMDVSCVVRNLVVVSCMYSVDMLHSRSTPKYRRL